MEDEQFQHRIFNWAFENIYLCDKLLDSTIDGPLFEKSEFPKFPWTLQLGQSAKLASPGIRLFIKRDGDFGNTLVNFRVLIYDSSVKLLNAKFQKMFKKGLTWKSKVLITNQEFKAKFPSSENLKNIWNIRVQLMYNDLRNEPVEHSVDLKEKRMVGQDLKKYLKDPIFSDTFLKAGVEQLKAHKAILHARSVYIANILSSKGNVQIYKQKSIPLSNAQILKYIMLYLYSGDIYSLLVDGPLPIGIYKYAKQMRLYDLEWLTEPFESSGKTYVDSETVIYNYTIEGFETAINSVEPVKIESPPFGNNLEVFRLLITQDLSSRNISVSLKMEAGESAFVFLEISIVSDSKVCFKKKLIGHLQTDCCIVIPEFITVGEFQYVIKENLCLTVQVVYSKGEIKSKIERLSSKSVVDPSENPDLSIEDIYCATHNGYCTMSENMKALLQSSAYSDCTLVIGGEKLPAHKIILAARSPYFFQKFQINKAHDPRYTSVKEEIIELDINLTAEMMKIILEEMYTGSAEIESSAVADILYPLSQYFGIPSLEEKCKRNMKNVPIESDGGMMNVG